jgi:tetratricopeptide (TPR) repeat protein
MVALVHAKATLLYSIKSTNRAAEAFEEAVLMMTGRSQGGIRALVQKIQAILRLDQATLYGSPEAVPQDPVRSILLLPTRAKLTASLLFAGSGDNMPGLRYISDPLKRRNAVFTTSNSLLSLAKIFQDSMSTGSNGAVGGGSFAVADILALYYLSLSLHESPSTANNVGILLAGVQQPAQARVKASLQQQLQQQQQQPSLQGAGATGAGSGIDYAQYYKYGLMLDPGHVHLLTNYGSLLKDVGMLDAAIQKYEQAVARDPKFDIALTNLANTVKDRGRIKDAISYYRRAVDVNPAFAEAVCGLSTALSSVCDWKRRGGVFLEGGRYDRWHVDDNGELQDARLTRRSSGVMQQVADIVKKQLDDAACWGSGVLQAAVMDLLTDRMLAGSGATLEEVQMQLLSWSGRRWEGSQVVRYVERVTRAKMRQWYLDRHGRRMASPAAAYLRPRLPAALTVPTAPTVLPFHTFTCPLTARDIRTISQRNALRISCTTLKSTWLPDTVYPPPRPPAPHLNVGYVSSDFNNHPLAHL